MERGEEFTIKFEKDSNYRRVVISHAFASLSNGNISVDIVEEMAPTERVITIGNDGMVNQIDTEHTFINLVHGTIIISPTRLPLIINSLQQALTQYQETRNTGGL